MNFFFRNSKHIFFDKSKRNFLNPNDVMKFINTKSGKKNFLIFLENHNTSVFVLLWTYEKKYENKSVSSRVLTSGNFAKDMALSKPGFGLLHLFWDWMTLMALKLFPTVVHAGLVGLPILTHYRLWTERVQSEWKCFTSPCGGWHLTRAGY